MTNYISEANRYLENARELLSTKAQKDGRYYQDKKYVKLAGHAAYSGVLVALDGLLGEKSKGRKSVEWYKEQLAKVDKKVLSAFNAAYDTLHLSMAYDGNLSVDVSKSGLNDAESLINWVDNKTSNK